MAAVRNTNESLLLSYRKMNRSTCTKHASIKKKYLNLYQIVFVMVFGYLTKELTNCSPNSSKQFYYFRKVQGNTSKRLTGMAGA